MPEASFAADRLILVLLAGALVTYAARAAGVVTAGRIDPASPIFTWIGCVAYALLAGLVARMILLPLGPLDGATLGERLFAVGVGVAVFAVTRRNLVAGVGAGTAALLVAAGI